MTSINLITSFFNLRVSNSFVQEFVSSPLDGVSLLLEVLRSVQLSQSMPMNGTTTMPAPGAMPRPNQSYQRRALLDELACLGVELRNLKKN